jgi:hypothetical protein
MGKERFQLFSFLGRFFAEADKGIEINSLKQKILSTNWPQVEKRPLTPTTVIS